MITIILQAGKKMNRIIMEHNRKYKLDKIEEVRREMPVEKPSALAKAIFWSIITIVALVVILVFFHPVASHSHII